MSDAVLAAVGYPSMLTTLLRQQLWYAHLFVNEVTPASVTRKSDLIESTAAGYAPIRLDRWTTPAMRGGVAFAVVDALIWVLDVLPPPLPVRGYYVTDGPDGELLWAWRRPGPGWLPTEGDATLVVYVNFTFPPPPAS